MIFRYLIQIYYFHQRFHQWPTVRLLSKLDAMYETKMYKTNIAENTEYHMNINMNMNYVFYIYNNFENQFLLTIGASDDK